MLSMILIVIEYSKLIQSKPIAIQKDFSDSFCIPQLISSVVCDSQIIIYIKKTVIIFPTDINIIKLCCIVTVAAFSIERLKAAI